MQGLGERIVVDQALVDVHTASVAGIVVASVAVGALRRASVHRKLHVV